LCRDLCARARLPQKQPPLHATVCVHERAAASPRPRTTPIRQPPLQPIDARGKKESAVHDKSPGFVRANARESLLPPGEPFVRMEALRLTTSHALLPAPRPRALVPVPRGANSCTPGFERSHKARNATWRARATGGDVSTL